MNDQFPTSHIPADIAVAFAIANSVLAWLPTAITVISGLLAIAWYCRLFYLSFKGKNSTKE